MTLEEVLPIVTVYTDGGCDPNPGIGGWGAVLRFGEKCKELSGGELQSTNNRMELTAAVQALTILNKRCHVRLHTDSQYVKKGMSEWIKAWKQNGWKTAAKKPVQNVDLWRSLDEQCARHRIEWRWVKAHVGIADNERCDTLATREIQRLRKMQKSR